MTQLLTFRCRSKTFGIEVGVVEEIVPVTRLSDIPTKESYLRGGITVRGQIISLYNFRGMVGDPSLLSDRQQLDALFAEREREHVMWVDALRTSVQQGTPFREAIDPAKCALGRWLASYETNDYNVLRLFEKIEKPHKELHELASVVFDPSMRGKTETALDLVERGRAAILEFFVDFRKTLVTDLRELALVLRSSSGHSYAISVDSVDNIRELESEGMSVAGGEFHSLPVVSRVWSSDDATILEVDRGYLDQVADTQVSRATNGETAAA
ncbi:MAG: chemotaxis protein CheW [Candidatus Eisenbacteria bacterium]